MHEEVGGDFAADSLRKGNGGFVVLLEGDAALLLVLEVLAHAGEVNDSLDAVVGQDAWVSYAGVFEDAGRAVGACGEDDFFVGGDGREGVCVGDLDALGCEGGAVAAGRRVAVVPNDSEAACLVDEFKIRAAGDG